MPPWCITSICHTCAISMPQLKFGIAFKLGGGPHSSCKNFVGLELAIMIVWIGNNLRLGKGSLRNPSKRSKSSNFSMILCYGLYGLGAMTRCSIMNNGTILRLSTLFGMTSSCTPRQLGNGWSSKSSSTSSPLKLCYKDSTIREVLGMSFVEGTICKSLGIGNNNAIR